MARTVGALIDILAGYPTDTPITIESEGEGAVGYELQDHGVVDGRVILVFEDVTKSVGN